MPKFTVEVLERMVEERLDRKWVRPKVPGATGMEAANRLSEAIRKGKGLTKLPKV